MVRRPFVVLAGALALVVAAAAESGAQRAGSRSAARIDTTVAFARDGRIDVSIPAGDITVTGWDRDAVRLEATSEAGELDVEWTGSRFEVDQPVRRRNSGQTRIQLSVPRGAHVSLDAIAGDLVVRGVGGRVEADANSGTIEVSDLSGSAELTTTAGDIRGRNLAGRVSASTTSGNLELVDVRGEIDASTTAGAVRLSGIQSSLVKAGAMLGNVEFAGSFERGGRYTFNAHAGNVIMEISQSASATFRVHSFGGDVQTDVPLTLDGAGLSRGQPTTFRLGAGDATVSAITHAGNIIIRRAERQNR
jgi:DUF4097 and DUF4098 domain-containing protein YvlB